MNNNMVSEAVVMTVWIKRKTRTMVECDACGALICWNKMNGAKYDEYYQRGKARCCRVYEGVEEIVFASPRNIVPLWQEAKEDFKNV